MTLTNEQRANSIRGILGRFKEYAGLSGEQDADVIGDLICNLAHYCDAENVELGLAIDRAYLNYTEEAPSGKQSVALSFVEMADKKQVWTCQYSGDDGDQVELVYCDRKPTFDEVVAQFEHLQEQVAKGYMSEEFMNIQPYAGIPTIK